jgi:hypothetical protein
LGDAPTSDNDSPRRAGLLIDELGDLSIDRDQRVGIGEIDNRSLATAQVGPMTQPLSELYTQRTATEGVQVVE